MSRGFTLLECIVVMVVAALLGTMLMGISGPATRAARPLDLVTSQAGAGAVMANITADYLANHQAGLSGLSTAVGAEGSSQTNAYGSYTVVHNRYVTFVAGTEAPCNPGDADYPNYLKVSISRQGMVLGGLFARTQ